MARFEAHLIAIVAPDLEFRTALQESLAGGGYSISAFGEAEPALAAMSTTPPDLVIASLSSAHLEGWTLCRTLRSSPHPGLRRLPVLVVSEDVHGEEAGRITAELGADRLLPFPIAPQELLAQIESSLRRSSEGWPAGPGQRLQRDEERFRSSLKDAKAGYFFIDTEGCFRWVNDAWLRLHGYSRLDEVAGRHFSLTQVDEDLGKATEIVRTLLSGAPIPSGEFRRKRRDGSVGFHIFSAQRVMDGERVAGLEGFLIDTTDLRAAEERFAVAFENFPAAAAISTVEEGTLLMVNRQFEAVFGFRREELIGNTTVGLGILSPERRAELGVQLRQQGRLSGAELRATAKGGRVVDCTLNIELIRVGGQDRLLSMLLDVTGRKRAEEELDLSRQWQTLHVQQTPLAVIEFDLEGRVRAWNPGAVRMFGFSPEEAIGQHWTFMVPRPVWGSLDGVWEGLVTRRGGSRSTNQNITKDGRTISCEWFSTALADRAGDIIGVASLVMDVTERELAAAALRERNRYIETILENAPIGFAVNTIHDGKGVFVGSRFEEIYGVPRGSLTSVEDYFEKVYLDPEFREQIRARIMADMQSGDAVRMQWENIPITTAAGERKVVTAINIPIFEQNLMVSTVQDVTGRRRAEEEREKLKLKLEQAQKMESVGRLAGGVAHDFNNLLTVINGYGDLALGQVRPEDPLRGPLEKIRKAGEQAASLTRQLLAFSRKQVVEPAPVNLNDLILEARELLGRMVGEEIEILCELDPDPGRVMADPGQFHQILMNLTVNARDAMPEGGRLTVRSRRLHLDEAAAAFLPGASAGSYVLMEVSDTGVGMSEEVQRKAFEPFFTTKREGEGTGLGLSMVYGIVRQAGGWIQIDSQLGTGTTFRIGLPLLEQSESEALSVRPNAARLEGAETILVAEDQDEVRELALVMLKGFGYRTLEARSGREALAIAENHAGSIDLLLTDVVMPGMTGKQLADRLRPLRPKMKVLYMSGYTSDVLSRRDVTAAGIDYIEKPFSAQALARKVRTVLREARPAAKVLVVDDEKCVRDLFASILSDAGYEVRVAEDGEQAEKTLEADAFDLVITDLVMPNREGIETIVAIRRRYPELKVIAVSGAFGGQFLKSASILGASAALAKPVSPAQLLSAVRTALS